MRRYQNNFSKTYLSEINNSNMLKHEDAKTTSVKHI